VSEPTPEKNAPPQLKSPSSARLFYIGGTATVALFLWIATIAVAGITESGDVPHVIFQLMFTGAATTTVVAVLLGISHHDQQVVAHNQAVLVEAIGQLARNVEQLAARVERIDPMAIYAAVAGDLLNQEKRN
jgi:hypothetical protein